MSKEIDILTIVNKTNQIDKNYIPQLLELSTGSGCYCDRRCVYFINKMIEDCKKFGHNIKIISAFRSYEYQKELFQNSIECFVKSGMSNEQAIFETSIQVARPGCSEHQTGLAFDITDMAYEDDLTDFQGTLSSQKWLLKHCHEYGFILRYPKGKSDITGFSYEPWHYRFVGIEHAKKMIELDLVLEEYVCSYNL